LLSADDQHRRANLLRVDQVADHRVEHDRPCAARLQPDGDRIDRINADSCPRGGAEANNTAAGTS
jgi:hypothetical protein